MRGDPTTGAGRPASTTLASPTPGTVRRSGSPAFATLGGMPEAVAVYAERRSLLEADRIKEGILQTLRDDFAKYRRRISHERLTRVFDRLPALVARKFKYVNVSREDTAREIGRCLRLLELARVVYRVRQSGCSGVPLGADARDDAFKLLFLDVGLLLRAAGLDGRAVEREPDLMLANAGAVAEQLVGQHLLYARPSWEEPELHYWAREEPTSAAEVDFVVARGQSLIPVEVKAGKTGRLRSLWQFVAAKRPPVALRFSTGEPSLSRVSHEMHDGTPVSFRLLSLPLYLADHALRLTDEALADS